MTAVEGIERKVNKHLRKWLGIPPSFTSVGLYIRSGQLQLPLSLVVEEFKVAKCRAVMMLKDSTDEMVRGYVGGEEHWRIYWQDARLLLARADIAGATTRSSEH